MSGILRSKTSTYPPTTGAEKEWPKRKSSLACPLTDTALRNKNFETDQSNFWNDSNSVCVLAWSTLKTTGSTRRPLVTENWEIWDSSITAIFAGSWLKIRSSRFSIWTREVLTLRNILSGFRLTTSRAWLIRLVLWMCCSIFWNN